MSYQVCDNRDTNYINNDYKFAIFKEFIDKNFRDIYGGRAFNLISCRVLELQTAIDKNEIPPISEDNVELLYKLAVRDIIKKEFD